MNVPAALVVPVVADHVGKVLHEGSTPIDVEHLEAAADAEERQPVVDRGGEQGVFPRIAKRVCRVGLLVPLGPVPLGCDVATAGDDESVEPRDDLVGDVGIDRLGRQQHGDPAGVGDRGEVHLGQEGRAHIPDAGLRLLQIGGQTDYGSAH